MPATCQPYRDALSARADDEVPPVDARALRTHLDGCSTCTAFAAAVEDLARRTRVVPAEPVPDLTASILAAVDTPDAAPGRFDQLRGLLALVGVVQLLLAVPALVASHDLAAHVTREAGIFEVALGIGFLLAARRPARVGGLLPVAAVVAALVVLTSVGDLLGGTTTWVQETPHLLEVVGTALLWTMDRHHGRARLAPATP